jgi:hypothetical protein
MTEYNIIEFYNKSNGEDIDIEELEKFIEDSEIVLSSFGVAWPKSFINKVGNSLRGATLEFNDGSMTHGYNIQSKLVLMEK